MIDSIQVFFFETYLIGVNYCQNINTTYKELIQWCLYARFVGCIFKLVNINTIIGH